ncbi:MAG: lipid-A-disaccharide synthase [Kiritimatiellae bacterium]|nr:lipid-A-disaccharide synthase [Kiritimatiellia bacterium]
MKVLLLAGEESGLVYAEGLKARLSDCEIRGYGDYGFKTADLAVMGFWPVIKKLFYFLRVARTMKRAIAEWRPDVVVTVDYPGLNLKLAAFAKSRGVPAVHLVCPQVWAWHRGRIPKVAAALTKLLCFFPFEPELFVGTGLDAKFIGHPMVDVFAQERTDADGAAAAASGKKTLALLPGSRMGEIARNMPRLLAALALLGKRDDLEVVVPAANARAEALLPAMTANAPFVRVQRGGARDLLRRADCAAVASGTATLEAALARCPTVLVYAVSPLLAWFARRVIKGVHFVGLANVIWEKSRGGQDAPAAEAPMPELLQEAFTPEAVAGRLRAWLDDPAARADAVKRLDDAMALLSSDGDALGRAADEIRSAAEGRA